MSIKSDMLERKRFLRGSVPKKLLALNAFMAVLYFGIVAFGFTPSNAYLFALLIAGELFHLGQVVGFISTVWQTEYRAPFKRSFVAPIDVFITVAGEPTSIVAKTAEAAMAMDYPNFNVYLLNDGYVAGKDNWREIEDLAKQFGIGYFTRRTPGGAKAGNINHALKRTHSPYVVIFDADHVPHADFLKKTMGYFTDSKLGFVQTPQYYKNHAVNAVATVAWEQQTLFFGPIMKGKNRLGAAFMCGTNMVVKREALEAVGGMVEFNIAEDFLTSLLIHAKGYRSIYVPEVLAEGLAPEDFLSYYKQQYRWTRGSLEVIFKYNPLLMRGLTWNQRIQYISSASYYLSGVIVLMNAMLPIVFLFTGLVPVETSTMILAMSFMPYIFLNLYALQAASNFSYSYRAISFSLSAFYLQMRALVAIALNQQTKFVVTSKQQVHGNFLYLAIPHILYILAYLVGLGVAVNRQGVDASVINNSAWALLNIAIFIPFILAAMPKLRRMPVLDMQLTSPLRIKVEQ